MSDGFDMAIDGDAGRFATAETAVRTNLASAAEVLADTLLDHARALASGRALQVRSGELVDSLTAETRAGVGGFVARVSTDRPYAAILEYGGEIPAHEIRPRDAKALRFRGGAGEVFAAVVRVPQVHIEAHSFLGRALDEVEAEIRTTLIDHVAQTFASLT